MTVKDKSARALVLAAGFGSRLMPYTADRPKCMVELEGESVLERQLQVFNALGIEDVAVVSGHESSAIPTGSLTIFRNDEYSKTNMVVSLMKAREWIENEDRDLIISYGDIVFNTSVLRALLDSERYPIGIVSDANWCEYWTARMDDPFDDAETFKTDDTGAITELGKKPSSMDEVQGQYIGLQRWTSDAIPKILSFYDSMDPDATYDGQSFAQMYMTSFIQGLIDFGIVANNVAIQNGWLELDTVSDYNLYQTMAAQGTLNKFYDINEYKS